MAFFLYIWSIVGGIKGALMSMTVISSVTSIMLLCATIILTAEFSKKEETINAIVLFKLWLKKSVIIFIIVMTAYVIIPSKKDLAIIYIVPKIAQSEIASQIAQDAPELYKMGIDSLKSEILSNKPTVHQK